MNINIVKEYLKGLSLGTINKFITIIMNLVILNYSMKDGQPVPIATLRLKQGSALHQILRVECNTDLL